MLFCESLGSSVLICSREGRWGGGVNGSRVTTNLSLPPSFVLFTQRFLNNYLILYVTPLNACGHIQNRAVSLEPVSFTAATKLPTRAKTSCQHLIFPYSIFLSSEVLGPRP